MRRLLLKMMGDMRQEKMPFCFLMPAAEAIYRPFGFVFIYQQPGFVMGKEKKATALQAKGLIPEEDSDEYQRMRSLAAEWMERWLGSHYQVYAKRDDAYLKRLTTEIASEDGVLDVLYDGDEIAALAGWWGKTKREQRLLYGDEPYVMAADNLQKPGIMARIISPEVFVKAIRLKEAAGCGPSCILPIRLQDPLIPENDGLWFWHLGRNGSWMERKEWTETPAGRQDGFLPPLSLTIEEMTAWLFGYEAPEAVRAYEDLIEPLHGVFLDEVV